MYMEIGFPMTLILSPNFTPFPSSVLHVEQIAKNRIFDFQMIKLCCKVVPISNFNWKSCTSKCLEGTCVKLSKSMHSYAFYNDFSARLTPSSKRYISEMAASICMCDTSLERILNGLIGGKFIYHLPPPTVLARCCK